MQLLQRALHAIEKAGIANALPGGFPVKARRQTLHEIGARRNAEPMQGPLDQDLRSTADHEPNAGHVDGRQTLGREGAYQCVADVAGRVGNGAVEIQDDRAVLARNHATILGSCRAASTMRLRIGMRISSMASSILPPGTTIVLRREMKELSIMASR